MQDQNSREASLFVVPLVQLMVGVLLFASLLHARKTLIIASVLILGLMILAKIWSGLSSSGVTCLSTVDKDRLFPGETCTLEIRAENAKFLPVWLQAAPFFSGGLTSVDEGEESVRQSGLLGYQGVSFRWTLAARKRGIYRVGPPRVRVGDYFGFFPREKKANRALDVVVYPRLIPLKHIPLPRRDFFGVPGTESPVQDPVYILGTRDYQHDQPARHIHWKASARHNRLQEKIFEPTVQEKALLVLEVDQFEKEGAADEFEDTLEVIASLAVQLDQKGYAVGLATNGELTGGGSSLVSVAAAPLHLSSILEILARVRMKKRGDLIDMLRAGLSLTWGVSCIHFSCGRNVSTRMAEEYFTSRRAASLFVLCRPPAEEPRDEHRIRSRTYTLDDFRVERGEDV